MENYGEFSLAFGQQSIFPQCRKSFKVSWTKAQCLDLSLNFRLRIFAVPEGGSVERSYYLEEIHLGKILLITFSVQSILAVFRNTN